LWQWNSTTPSNTPENTYCTAAYKRIPMRPQHFLFHTGFSLMCACPRYKKVLHNKHLTYLIQITSQKLKLCMYIMLSPYRLLLH
jgi:hypothetical protein